MEAENMKKIENNNQAKDSETIFTDLLKEELVDTLNHKINVEETKMKIVQEKIEKVKCMINIGDFLYAMQCINDIKSAVNRLDTAVEDMFA